MSATLVANITGPQRKLLQQICQNKNECGDETATILSPSEIRTGLKLADLNLVKINGNLASPTYYALTWFPQWNPDQLLLF